jgi:carboxylesterase type B
VLDVFKVDPLVSRQEQLDYLRKIPHQKLVEGLSLLRLDSFRAVTDQDFIHADMIERLRDGTMARGFKDRGMRIIVGETETEVRYSGQYNPKFGMN